jgi:hypothetical protein
MKVIGELRAFAYPPAPEEPATVGEAEQPGDD